MRKAGSGQRPSNRPGARHSGQKTGQKTGQTRGQRSGETSDQRRPADSQGRATKSGHGAGRDGGGHRPREEREAGKAVFGKSRPARRGTGDATGSGADHTSARGKGARDPRREEGSAAAAAAYHPSTNQLPSRPRPEEPMRIAKAMARAGLCSRREAERWIEEGRVAVNGATLRSPARDVGPNDRIVVDGRPLPEAEAVRLWRYYKPKGLVTTHRDPEGRPTVFEALVASSQILQRSIVREKLKAQQPDIYIDVEVDEFHVLEFHRFKDVMTAAGRARVGVLPAGERTPAAPMLASLFGGLPAAG